MDRCSQDEVDALSVLWAMKSSATYQLYNLGREVVKVASDLALPILILPETPYEPPGDPLSHPELLISQLEGRLRQWIPTNYTPPVLWPVRIGRGVKFTAEQNATLAWLLLAMDYPRSQVRKLSLTNVWKVAALLMGIKLVGLDPAKRIRNHVREIISLGPKLPLTAAERSELRVLVIKCRDPETGNISWARIVRLMKGKFGKPFGAGRIKDDWHNFFGRHCDNQDVPGKERSKRKRDDDSLVIRISGSGAVIVIISEQKAKRPRLE